METLFNGTLALAGRDQETTGYLNQTLRMGSTRTCMVWRGLLIL
nr:photosystem II CP43 chlorophyll apoprotein [Solanum imamense]UNZ92737.1 photosystem II CP43 chlorophyll apoprotein [Solanum imamense]